MVTEERKPDMAWSRIKKYSSQIFLAMAGGILLVLAFPKFSLGWIAWVALVPLILALRKVGPKTGFLLGLGFGFIHNMGLVYWTAYTMHMYGNIPMVQAIIILISLAGYLSLYPALFALALTWLKPRPKHLILIAPMLWVCLEMLRNTLLTGFPWELLGYSQYNHLLVIQVSDIFGVYGISALIVFANCVLATGVLSWLELPWQDKIPTRKGSLQAAAALAVTLVGVIGYGSWRMDATDQAMKVSDHAKVAVIQGNIDQAQKWDPRFQVLSTVKYRRLSLEPAAKGADLIIWPETATPFFLLADEVLTKMVMSGVKSAGAYFIIGSPSYVGGKQNLVYHNSAYMISPQAESKGKYDKVHLVPFGEYVPLRPFLPFIDKLVAQVGDFKPGRKGSTLAWEGHHAGVLICYEEIFPELARAMVRNGADLLVNITNDAWFGRTSAAFQHWSMAVFRAVENRRCLARAANTGISGFIDANGRILHATGLYKEAVVTEPVALMTSRSFYSRWGDWPLGFLTFGIAILFIGRRYKRSHLT